MNNFINKDIEVLIEKTVDGYSYGHTSNYLLVKVRGEYQHNSFITVIIESVDYPYCIAKVVEKIAV